MLAGHTITSVGPGTRARLQLALVQLVGLLTSPVGSRGSGRLIAMLGRVFGREGFLILEPTARARLKIGLYDAYWLSELLRNHEYEPETAKMLELVLDERCAFIDCGANVGWWSSIACQRIGASQRVVAIEASRSVFARLRENAALNGGCFLPIHAAVWESSDVELVVAADVDRHAWSSVDETVRAKLRRFGFHEESVPSIAIDDVIAQHIRGDVQRFVVKLDVEGAERQALRGAGQVLERDTVVIYEDHGRDRSHSTSTALFEMGMHVFGWTSEGRPARLADALAVGGAKPSIRHGYNFLACRPGTASHQLVSAACAAPASGVRGRV